MSWSALDVRHLRMDFIMIVREPDVSMSEACRQFNISRKTGYKWRKRYEASGLDALTDRSHRPARNPLRVGGDVVVELVRLRGKHRCHGPKKLRAKLLRKGFRPDEVPGLATIGRILRRSGLSETKRRGRPPRQSPTGSLSSAQQPNDVWTVDFKGWWRTGDGCRCEPLTIRDLYSRYLLCLRPVCRRCTEEVRTVFEEVFKRYGLPGVIRSDNGSPFASLTGPAGLTRLSAWWRTLGIKLERIAPGHPEQNGGHERMHGDLAREVQRQPAATVAREALRLERWRIEFNTDRPHEALGMKVPGEFYHPSSRKLTEVRPYIYSLAFERRRVRRDGCIRLEGRTVYLSEALGKQEVGLERLSETGWRVWFCDIAVSEISMADGRFSRRPVPTVPPSTPESCNPSPDNKVLPIT
jgi:transposase InsO family protein